MNMATSGFSDDSTALGARLRDLRLRRGLTLEEVGQSLNVTKACVCHWERGKAYPRRKVVEKLAQTLNTSVGYILTGQAADVNAADIVRRARHDIAAALGVDVSKISVEIDPHAWRD